MNVVVIGLGSMGRRRIRVIKNIDPACEILGVDLDLERRKVVETEYQVKTFAALPEAVNSAPLDAAFVCTPPLSHAVVMEQCLQLGLNVFTEINLVDTMYRENMELARQKNLKLFLSSTNLYGTARQCVSDNIQKSGGKVSYLYHVGQYLPDWHPWENYQNFFVGNKASNGCREIFAIELPWVIETFGKIKSVSAVKDKNTNLDIDYSDNYLVTITHENGNKGVFVCDVVSRRAMRQLEVFSENLHLLWDGTYNGIQLFDLTAKEFRHVPVVEETTRDRNYSDKITEKDYVHEVEAFFDFLGGKAAPRYTFEDDLDTLRIIDSIEA